MTYLNADEEEETTRPDWDLVMPWLDKRRLFEEFEKCFRSQRLLPTIRPLEEFVEPECSLRHEYALCIMAFGFDRDLLNYVRTYDALKPVDRGETETLFMFLSAYMEGLLIYKERGNPTLKLSAAWFQRTLGSLIREFLSTRDVWPGIAESLGEVFRFYKSMLEGERKRDVVQLGFDILGCIPNNVALRGVVFDVIIDAWVEEDNIAPLVGREEASSIFGARAQAEALITMFYKHFYEDLAKGYKLLQMLRLLAVHHDLEFLYCHLLTLSWRLSLADCRVDDIVSRCAILTFTASRVKRELRNIEVSDDPEHSISYIAAMALVPEAAELLMVNDNLSTIVNVIWHHASVTNVLHFCMLLLYVLRQQPKPMLPLVRHINRGLAKLLVQRSHVEHTGMLHLCLMWILEVHKHERWRLRIVRSRLFRVTFYAFTTCDLRRVPGALYGLLRVVRHLHAHPDPRQAFDAGGLLPFLVSALQYVQDDDRLQRAIIDCLRQMLGQYSHLSVEVASACLYVVFDIILGERVPVPQSYFDLLMEAQKIKFVQHMLNLDTDLSMAYTTSLLRLVDELNLRALTTEYHRASFVIREIIPDVALLAALRYVEKLQWKVDKAANPTHWENSILILRLVPHAYAMMLKDMSMTVSLQTFCYQPVWLSYHWGWWDRDINVLRYSLLALTCLYHIGDRGQLVHCILIVARHVPDMKASELSMLLPLLADAVKLIRGTPCYHTTAVAREIVGLINLNFCREHYLAICDILESLVCSYSPQFGYPNLLHGTEVACFLSCLLRHRNWDVAAADKGCRLLVQLASNGRWDDWALDSRYERLLDAYFTGCEANPHLVPYARRLVPFVCVPADVAITAVARIGGHFREGLKPWMGRNLRDELTMLTRLCASRTYTLSVTRLGIIDITMPLLQQNIVECQYLLSLLLEAISRDTLTIRIFAIHRGYEVLVKAMVNLAFPAFIPCLIPLLNAAENMRPHYRSLRRSLICNGIPEVVMELFMLNKTDLELCYRVCRFYAKVMDSNSCLSIGIAALERVLSFLTHVLAPSDSETLPTAIAAVHGLLSGSDIIRRLTLKRLGRVLRGEHLEWHVRTAEQSHPASTQYKVLFHSFGVLRVLSKRLPQVWQRMVTRGTIGGLPPERLCVIFASLLCWLSPGDRKLAATDGLHLLSHVCVTTDALWLFATDNYFINAVLSLVRPGDTDLWNAIFVLHKAVAVDTFIHLTLEQFNNCVVGRWNECAVLIDRLVLALRVRPQDTSVAFRYFEPVLRLCGPLIAMTKNYYADGEHVTVGQCKGCLRLLCPLVEMYLNVHDRVSPRVRHILWRLGMLAAERACNSSSMVVFDMELVADYMGFCAVLSESQHAEYWKEDLTYYLTTEEHLFRSYLCYNTHVGLPVATFLRLIASLGCGPFSRMWLLHRVLDVAQLFATNKGMLDSAVLALVDIVASEDVWANLTLVSLICKVIMSSATADAQPSSTPFKAVARLLNTLGSYPITLDSVGRLSASLSTLAHEYSDHEYMLSSWVDMAVAYCANGGLPALIMYGDAAGHLSRLILYHTQTDAGNDTALQLVLTFLKYGDESSIRNLFRNVMMVDAFLGDQRHLGWMDNSYLASLFCEIICAVGSIDSQGTLLRNSEWTTKQLWQKFPDDEFVNRAMNMMQLSSADFSVPDDYELLPMIRGSDVLTRTTDALRGLTRQPELALHDFIEEHLLLNPDNAAMPTIRQAYEMVAMRQAKGQQVNLFDTNDADLVKKMQQVSRFFTENSLVTHDLATFAGQEMLYAAEFLSKLILFVPDSVRVFVEWNIASSTVSVVSNPSNCREIRSAATVLLGYIVEFRDPGLNYVLAYCPDIRTVVMENLTRLGSEYKKLTYKEREQHCIANLFTCSSFGSRGGSFSGSFYEVLDQIWQNYDNRGSLSSFVLYHLMRSMRQCFTPALHDSLIIKLNFHVRALEQMMATPNTLLCNAIIICIGTWCKSRKVADAFGAADVFYKFEIVKSRHCGHPQHGSRTMKNISLATATLVLGSEANVRRFINAGGVPHTGRALMDNQENWEVVFGIAGMIANIAHKLEGVKSLIAMDREFLRTLVQTLMSYRGRPDEAANRALSSLLTALNNLSVNYTIQKVLNEEGIPAAFFKLTSLWRSLDASTLVATVNCIRNLTNAYEPSALETYIPVLNVIFKVVRNSSNVELITASCEVFRNVCRLPEASFYLVTKGLLPWILKTLDAYMSEMAIVRACLICASLILKTIRKPCSNCDEEILTRLLDLSRQITCGSFLLESRPAAHTEQDEMDVVGKALALQRHVFISGGIDLCHIWSTIWGPQSWLWFVVRLSESTGLYKPSTVEELFKATCAFIQVANGKVVYMPEVEYVIHRHHVVVEYEVPASEDEIVETVRPQPETPTIIPPVDLVDTEERWFARRRKHTKTELWRRKLNQDKVFDDLSDDDIDVKLSHLGTYIAPNNYETLPNYRLVRITQSEWDCFTGMTIEEQMTFISTVATFLRHPLYLPYVRLQSLALGACNALLAGNNSLQDALLTHRESPEGEALKMALYWIRLLVSAHGCKLQLTKQILLFVANSLKQTSPFMMSFFPTDMPALFLDAARANLHQSMPRRFAAQATLMRNHVRTFGKIMRGILAGDPDARQEIKAFLDPSPDLEMQLGWQQDAFPFGVYSIPCRQYIRRGGILICWTLKTTNRNNKAFCFWRANGSLTKLIYSIRDSAGAGEWELFLLSDVRTNLWAATMRVDKGREMWPPLPSGSRNWPQDKCFSLAGHQNRNPPPDDKPTVLCLKAEDGHERDLLMEIMALWCLGLAAT